MDDSELYDEHENDELDNDASSIYDDIIDEFMGDVTTLPADLHEDNEQQTKDYAAEKADKVDKCLWSANLKQLIDIVQQVTHDHPESARQLGAQLSKVLKNSGLDVSVMLEKPGPTDNQRLTMTLTDKTGNGIKISSNGDSTTISCVGNKFKTADEALASLRKQRSLASEQADTQKPGDNASDGSRPRAETNLLPQRQPKPDNANNYMPPFELPQIQITGRREPIRRIGEDLPVPVVGGRSEHPPVAKPGDSPLSKPVEKPGLTPGDKPYDKPTRTPASK